MKRVAIILMAVVALLLLALLLFAPRGRQMTQRAQYVDAKPTECLTKDNKQLEVRVRVGWRVADESAFARSFPGDSTALAQSQLGGVIYRADAEVAGQHDLSDFVNPDGSEATLSKIEKQLRSVVEGKLDKSSGIMIASLAISRVTQR